MTEEKKDDGGPAFPVDLVTMDERGDDSIYAQKFGLTKREYFAAMAMMPLERALSNKEETITKEKFAERCVKIADALIAELKK